MMATNYPGMPANALRKTKRAIAAFSAPAIPKIGQIIRVDPSLIIQDDKPDGKPMTPMTKIRYDTRGKTWRQVPRHDAGMFVFFNNDPEAFHTKFRVTSIIPSGTGCYADLI